MSEPGGPGRRGRHSAGDGAGEATPWASGSPSGAGTHRAGDDAADRPRFEPWADATPTGRLRRVSGLLDRSDDRTGPLPEPDWWSHDSSDHPDHPRARQAQSEGHRPDTEHPSGPLPPLPPRPAGVWDRLRPRTTGHPAGNATMAHDPDHRDEFDARDLDAPAPADDQWDRTGGLEVIGAHVEDDAPRRGRSRRRRSRADRPQDEQASRSAESHVDHDSQHHDSQHHDSEHHESDHHDAEHDDAIPVAPYDRRANRRRGKRRPWAALVTLVVLAGVVGGIILGAQALLGLMKDDDYTGQGTGSVEVRVEDGDTLTDIARTLVDSDVIASTGPFVDAAEDHPEATSIQPGVYGLRLQMSGKAALDMMLGDESRLLSRVTIPEGSTVSSVLARLAESTGIPQEQFAAAAADPAALGLPAYANGMLEGFLFPATYSFEPDDTPAEMLALMVDRAEQSMDQLGIPVERRLEILTKASLVQGEASTPEDMGKVARVLENRLADGMPLQLDSTVNYANSKGGITTTAADRANPSPYNTYLHPGLPPGAINNPGDDALRAALNPTPGDWRYFVVVNPDAHDTRFAVTKAEHDQNVQLFRQWLQANPGG